MSQVYRVKKMNRQEAQTYLHWRYPAPYEFYNTPVPYYEESLAEIMDNQVGELFFAVYVAEELYGIFSYQLLEDGRMEIGLGIRPEDCGKGQGLEMTEKAIAFARKHLDFQGTLCLRVADFNLRAMKVYERAGFVKTGEVLALCFNEVVNFIQMELVEETR